MDRVLAPMALIVSVYAGYCVGGVVWVFFSWLPVGCHILAHVHAKKGMYDQFVVWHSLWHAVGAGMIVACFSLYGEVGSNLYCNK